MPIYTLQCKACHSLSEHIMGMLDGHESEIKCPTCGERMNRRDNRAYWAEGIQIQGDTVAGGCSYDYYDENLGVHVRSKQHRKDEMLKQGLREYAPDPEIKKYRDEARYIKSSAPKGDREAGAAARKLAKEAQVVRRKKQISRVMDSAPLPNIKVD